MPETAVIGAQWGDEAKGKIVHFLAREADLAVRFNGGPNAGHTVQDARGTVQLHLVPAGALQPGCKGVIAHGVAVDPQVLEQELDSILRQGRPRPVLYLSHRAPLILPHHRLVEELEGTAKRIGTTRKGVGPAYQERVARRGLRVGDLAQPEAVLERLRELKVALEKGYGRAGFDPEALCQKLSGFYRRWQDRIVDTRALVAGALAQGRSVVFEGAQGTLLDLDLGTYPYVTSSTTTVHGIGWGVGVRLSGSARVVGVAKAYTTRVGEGPFPTEDPGAGGELLRARGREYGTTTGRPRRCGWLDLVALRYAQEVNQFTELAVTKLDVLSGLEEIPVCTAYELAGRRVEDFPGRLSELAAARPLYQPLPGWDEDIRPARTWEELPENARRYLLFIEEQLEVPVTLIGVGPGEDELIVRR
ncbi:adenylosuccinate synthase [Candidatus Bipolaricaulota bacterium]|nr:adenylosuccinate synthase [Candidatus Bipolaricaulota bacterium]